MDSEIITNIFGDLTPVATIIILAIGVLSFPAVQMFGKKHVVTWIYALVIALVALAVDIILLMSDYAGYYAGEDDMANWIVCNPYTLYMQLLFLTVLTITVFVCHSSIETTKNHSGAFYSLLFGATTGMLFVVTTYDLLTIFVGVELTSISSYAMVALKRKDGRASEAAVKYAIVGGMSTALTLYGISMVYGTTGTTDLILLQAIMFDGPPFTWLFAIGMICMIAGYGFKIAMVPFHMWAPDVYEGAATPVSMFLATASKKMGLGVFIQVFLFMFIMAKTQVCGEAFQYVFAILAAVTMTVGNIVAIAQTNIKRMLAYSSIAQAGYILIMMVVMTPEAEAAGLFHMFTHVFMKGGAFLIVGALICAGIGEKISDYKGLAKRAPLIAFAMMLFLFSLAGIPPLAGFTSKFFLFASAVGGPGDASAEWVWLALVAILNSAISLYYYARVVKAMYIEKGASTEKIKIPKPFLVAILVCVVFVIVLGVYPDLIFGYAEAAANATFGI
ncbi:MAG: NADH-quinone oxidoreductase subunit N [Thermoplasmata archaeon]|jgi:NADH-quinone oxidoreductase subunit N|nr:NADH-quinone oxidoreductase subunit N [Thermoplasmata archaeon]